MKGLVKMNNDRKWNKEKCDLLRTTGILQSVGHILLECIKRGILLFLIKFIGDNVELQWSEKHVCSVLRKITIFYLKPYLTHHSK